MRDDQFLKGLLRRLDKAATAEQTVLLTWRSGDVLKAIHITPDECERLDRMCEVSGLGPSELLNRAG